MEARATTLVAVGAGCWLLTLVYFAAQPVVAAAWDPPYSVAANTISDLGNTSCGVFDRPDGTSAYVCSPRHTLMNATFVVTGLLTTAGAVLTRRRWPRRALATVALALIALTGLGAVLVGLAPADVSPAPHVVGALLQVPGAVGPLLLGIATVRQRPWEAVPSRPRPGETDSPSGWVPGRRGGSLSWPSPEAERRTVSVARERAPASTSNLDL